MPKFNINIIIFCIITTVLYSNNSSAYENIVQNGEFSDALNNWNFVDGSIQAGSSFCAGVYSEAKVQGEIAIIHGHLAYGDGYLYQNLPKKMPYILEFDYKLQGTCSSLVVILKHNLTAIYTYGISSDGILNYVASTYLDISHVYPNGIMYSWSGKVKVKFDYESEKLTVYFNDVEIDQFDLLSTDIDKIELGGRNSCCDGRNDVYAYFDNITLIPYSYPVEEEIPLPTNHSIIVTNSDWKNIISASAVKLPVIVSETGYITPEIQKFVQDYNPDYIYTIGFSTGLSDSFEIAKEDVPELFFPDAEKAVYVSTREKGIFASQIGSYLGMPVVFEKTGNYSGFMDLESMTIPEIQDFYLEKVKENGGKLDYLLLADLESSDSLLAGYIAAFRNGYIVPVANKSFEGIRETINGALDLLGSKKFYHKKFYHKAVAYKAGNPLYLAILGGNETIPHVKFFDPGLEVFNDKDGNVLYSDLGYSDSNRDGFFDLALGGWEVD